MSVMKSVGLAFVAATALAAAPSAFARSHTSVSIGFSGPGYSIGYTDCNHCGWRGGRSYGHVGYYGGYAPAYYAPAYYGPAYYPAYYDTVVYERPAYRTYYRGHGYRDHGYRDYGRGHRDGYRGDHDYHGRDRYYGH